MPSRRDFYDPFVQGAVPEPEQASPIRGFQMEAPGTYVLLEDVVTAVREYAQSLDDANAGALIHDVANWLQSGETPPQQEAATPSMSMLPPIADDARIEIYPTESGSGRIKWYSRLMARDGVLVAEQGNGSFDRSEVEVQAEQRWPGIPMYEVQDENERSVWSERGERGHRHGLFPTAVGR